MSAAADFNASSALPCNSSVASCSLSYNPPNRWVAWVVIVVCCVLGIPGNLAVIVKLVRQRRRRRSKMTPRLFLNLAACDLLMLLGTVGAAVVSRQRFNGETAFHQLKHLFFNFFYVANHNIVLLLSVQRYYQVLRPQKWSRLGPRGERGLLVGMWLVAAVLSLPNVFFHFLLESPQERFPFFFTTEVVNISYVVLTYPVLVTFYVRLLRGVNQTAFFNDSRMTRLIIVVITIFLVLSIVPLIIRMALTYAIVTKYFLPSGSKLYLSVFCFYLVNSGLDPFLYFFASRRQRRGRAATKRPVALSPPGPLHDYMPPQREVF